MTIESLFDFLEIDEDAIVLKENMKVILKTHDDINEFYLRLNNDHSKININRELYKYRLAQQSNSIVKEIIYQDLQENPVQVLMCTFNESIVDDIVEKLKLYNIEYSELLELRNRNVGIRLSELILRLAKT